MNEDQCVLLQVLILHPPHVLCQTLASLTTWFASFALRKGYAEVQSDPLSDSSFMADSLTLMLRNVVSSVHRPKTCDGGRAGPILFDEVA